MNEQQQAAMRQALEHMEWSTPQGKAAYEALRSALEQVENYQRNNPLGGPAKVFEAMADAIRAGDDYHATLRAYGFSEQQPADEDLYDLAVKADNGGQP